MMTRPPLRDGGSGGGLLDAGRTDAGPGYTAPDAGPPPPPPGLCTDTCEYASDGYCDDGGAGSDGAVCPWGSDCADCGPRTGTPPPPPMGGCTDSCPWAFDFECDDGGPGAITDLCEFGTDCFDCGPR
jgi:hypothetical protein